MTGFIVACAGMMLVAVTLFAWPLLRSKSFSLPDANRWLTVIVIAAVLSVMSGGVYIAYQARHGGQWHADNVPAERADENVQLAQAIHQLQAQVDQNPKSVTAWEKLGAANVMAKRVQQAIDAYQHAYDLSQGQDVEAVTGLAEALLQTQNQQTFMRGAKLLDDALKMQPMNPKALWYGGMVALQMQNLTLARDRFKAMLTLNPPERIRGMLEREVQDLDQQLGEPSAKTASPASTAAQSDRRITVHVKLDPKLKDQIKSPMTLFVLARDPAQGGPPYAVERHMSSEIPLTVELTKDKAMMPTRTIANINTVEVVARLSASGTPVQQSGDYAGSVQYSFDKQGQVGTVTIEINHQVP